MSSSSSIQQGGISFYSHSMSADEKTSLLHVEQLATRHSDWRHTLLLLVASVMGVGVLGLPLAFYELGAAPATLLLLLFGCGSVYSGVLINRLTLAAGPSSRYYSDLGYHAYGRRGRCAVRAVAYTYLFGTCASIVLTAAMSLVQVVAAVAGEGAPRLCLPYAALAVCALTLPLLQVRTLHELTWTAAAGILFIVAPVAIVVGVLAAAGGPAGGAVPPPVPPPHAAGTAGSGGAAFWRGGTGMATIMFAFAGQVIFVELQSEMRQPADFPRAVWWASVAYGSVYLLVAVAASHFLGSHVQAPVTLAMPTATRAQRAAKGVANLLLLLHVLVAFVINANVVNRAALQALVPERLQRRRLAWLGVTLTTLALWFVIANVVPFLQDLMGLMGATCGMALTYFFPIAFARKTLREKLGPRELRALPWVLALAALASLVATLSVIVNTIEHLDTSVVPPFSCGFGSRP